MTPIIIILLAGALGTYGHWLTRWKQGRTQSTFKEYLFNDISGTIQSGMANLSACAGFVAATPIDASPQLLMTTFLSVFSVAYMADSVLNVDQKPSLPDVKPTKTIKESRNEDAHKSLNDLLDSDS